MKEDLPSESRSPDPDTSSRAKNDILLGIFLFVGMNVVLLLAGNLLRNSVWRFLFSVSGDPLVSLSAFDRVRFALVLFMNAALFLYLIVKRPLMTVGIVAGIPVLVLVLVLLWLAVCLFVMLVWFLLVLLRVLGLA